MDIAQLVYSLATFLTPFLPYLLKAGEQVAEEAGKKFGAAAWDNAKTLWSKLRARVEAKPAAKETVRDVAQDPSNEDAQAALRFQLRKLLADDETLAGELTQWQADAQRTGVITASGNRSSGVGDITDSIIITGDRNVMQQGKYNLNIGQANDVAIGDETQVDAPEEGEKGQM